MSQSNLPVCLLLTSHVEYAERRASEWLDGNGDLDDMAGATTVAEALGIDDAWPQGGSDDQLAAVRELLDRALDADVIVIGGVVDDVELIETRSPFGELTGARLLVTTRGGVTLASGEPLWASSFTGEWTGRTAAYAALCDAARRIDNLAAGYRAAAGR